MPVSAVRRHAHAGCNKSSLFHAQTSRTQTTMRVEMQRMVFDQHK